MTGEKPVIKWEYVTIAAEKVTNIEGNVAIDGAKCIYLPGILYYNQVKSNYQSKKIINAGIWFQSRCESSY
jgi:hypothetical protein